MNNFNVEKFKELEGVKSLFENVNCIGNTNCFLIAYNRLYLPNQQTGIATSGTITGIKMGGIAGGIVGGIVGNAIENHMKETINNYINSLSDGLKIIENVDKYCGFLINRTETGIGFIPLTNNYNLIVKVKDFQTDLENFVFVKNEDIKSIEIKNLPMYFTKKLLKITFNEENNPSTSWTLPMKHKLIKYQEDNYSKFIKLI